MEMKYVVPDMAQMCIRDRTRADASTRMSADQISDVALSIEYVKQYTDSHSGISNNHAYLLRQLVVWQRLSVHLGLSLIHIFLLLLNLISTWFWLSLEYPMLKTLASL